jgi:hypothetical protein
VLLTSAAHVGEIERLKQGRDMDAVERSAGRLRKTHGGQKRYSEQGRGKLRMGRSEFICAGAPCSVSFLQELVTFAKYIIGKFFALAAVNQKAFVELLFWKNTAVVREMTQGYGSLDSG